jgi:hypothetical protein
MGGHIADVLLLGPFQVFFRILRQISRDEHM